MIDEISAKGACVEGLVGIILGAGKLRQLPLQMLPEDECRDEDVLQVEEGDFGGGGNDLTSG